MAPASEPVRLERLPAFAWAVIAVVGLSVLCTVVQVMLVRPYLWPAGTGATLAGNPTAQLPLEARPPDVAAYFISPPEIARVAPGSPADANHVVPHSTLLAQELAGDPQRAVRFDDRLSSEAGRIAVWRELYWVGVRGAVVWNVAASDGNARQITMDRPAALNSATGGWARRHLGMIVQMIVFTGAAVLLLLMRSYDLTAGLCVLALAFSAVGGGGPLLGEERVIPIVWPVLTVFAWVASPLAFPTIALAILYFPTRSRLLDRYPWLHAVPLLAAVPLVGPALMTGLYLAGLDSARSLSVWDATHPGVYYAAFATALAINVLAVGEGAYRYRFNHNANERRRIRMALYTAVPGVLAYAVRDGIPIVAQLFGGDGPEYRARCGSCSMVSSSCRPSASSTRSASRTCWGHESCCGAACSTRSPTAR